jgi:head-tail adaptor
MGEIGRMDRRVEVKKPTTTTSAMGAPQKAWAHLCYLQASREPVGESLESYVNNRLVVATRFKYKTHIRTDINETMRLVDDSVIYNILAVNTTGLFIEILVEKVVE